MSSGFLVLSHTTCQIPNILSADRRSYQKSSALLTALDALLRHRFPIRTIAVSVPYPVPEWYKPAADIKKYEIRRTARVNRIPQVEICFN